MRHQLLLKLYTAVLFLLGIFSFSNATSQTLINSTGNTLNGSSISFEYSVGEISITTISSSDYAVTQGLLQPIIKDNLETCKITEFVASAFSPNGDGLNDCFGLPHWPFTQNFEFSIFNRWGELIFYTKDISACWNGKYKGADQPIGVYVYMIKSKNFCGLSFKKGTFTLIR